MVRQKQNAFPIFFENANILFIVERVHRFSAFGEKFSIVGLI